MKRIVKILCQRTDKTMYEYVSIENNVDGQWIQESHRTRETPDQDEYEIGDFERVLPYEYSFGDGTPVAAASFALMDK